MFSSILYFTESFGISTNTTLPPKTTLPATDQLDNTEPHPTEIKEIIELITETIEITELSDENEAAEIFNEPMRTTSQFGAIDIVSRTQISGIPTTLIANGVTTTRSTATTWSATPAKIPSSQRPSPTPTVPHSTNSPSLTTLAENSSSSKQTTLFLNFTSKVATSTPSTTSVSPSEARVWLTSKPVTPSVELTTEAISSLSVTTNARTTTPFSTAKPSTSINRVSTLNPTVTPNISTPSITSRTPLLSTSSKATTLPLPELETNATFSTIKQTTVREHSSSSASPQSSTRAYLTTIYFPNDTKSTTDGKIISTTNHSTITFGNATTTPSSADELLSTTKDENENSTIKYVEDNPPDDRGKYNSYFFKF